MMYHVTMFEKIYFGDCDLGAKSATLVLGIVLKLCVSGEPKIGSFLIVNPNGKINHFT